MKKKNKRKGFSAIEMLIVIAVIALLVSVVVPVISNQSVKAKAAANAANLRTIESVVAMKLVEEPDAFEDYFKNGEVSNKVDNFVEKGWPQKVVDYFLGKGAAESMIKDYYLQFSDGRTGKTLTIEGTSPQIIISGVALPVAMEAPRRDGGTGLVIGEYDYMSVYICQDGVLAFYNNFTKEDFADVAEDGYYDGAASAGGVENSGGILGEIQKDVCQAQGRHEPGPGCKCRNCGAEAHVDADETKNLLGLSEYNSSTTLHECKCGKVFNAGHVYEGTDHKCKYKKTADEECPEVSPCVDLDPEDDGFLGWGGGEADHKCYLCGGDNNHAWCTTDNRGGGTWGNQPDHKCDTCGYEMSKCDAKGGYNDDTHTCSYCGEENPHAYVDGVCACGRPSHVAPNDCVDSDKDHNCDVNGCTNTTMGGAHTTNTNLNNGYHGCTYCTKDRVACSDGDKNHKCDTCGYTMSKCTDSNPKDHICDYGCGNKTMGGAHTTNTKLNNGYHGCTYCTKDRVACSEGDKKDQKCDTCGAYMGGGGGSCVTPDTLITLADGSKKRVDQLDGSEELLVWNLETGAYDSAPIMFIDSEAECEAEVIYLHFSDGTLVKVITEHGFWDYTLNMYVYLDRGAEAYIGHTFFKQSENGGEKVELVDVEFKTEVTTAWSPVTVGHLCYFVNDMLSMPGGIRGLFNIFDVDPETMAYDCEAMARDIETYGLLSYEELSSVIAVPEDMFNAAGGAYLNIAMGKGQLTEGELFAMIQRYSVHFE